MDLKIWISIFGCGQNVGQSNIIYYDRKIPFKSQILFVTQTEIPPIFSMPLIIFNNFDAKRRPSDTERSILGLTKPMNH